MPGQRKKMTLLCSRILLLQSWCWLLGRIAAEGQHRDWVASRARWRVLGRGRGVAAGRAPPRRGSPGPALRSSPAVYKARLRLLRSKPYSIPSSGGR